MALPGQYEPTARIKTFDNNATIITRGKMLKHDATNGGVVITAAAVTQQGPFFVGTETTTATSQGAPCVYFGEVYVTADGAIKVGAPVKASASTAGEVIEAVSGTDVESTIIGKYMGHENEGDGKAVATDAADAEVVRIFMNGVG